MPRKRELDNIFSEVLKKIGYSHLNRANQPHEHSRWPGSASSRPTSRAVHHLIGSMRNFNDLGGAPAAVSSIAGW